MFPVMLPNQFHACHPQLGPLLDVHHVLPNSSATPQFYMLDLLKMDNNREKNAVLIQDIILRIHLLS